MTADISQASFAVFVRFYNEIDAHFRRTLKLGAQEPRPGFRRLMLEYKRQHPWWQDDSALHLLADLRNMLTHYAGEPLFFLSGAAVTQIQQIAERLCHPPSVKNTNCLCDVLTVTPQHTLSDVLGLVRANSFSQFPLYDESVFQGLITENGITRWLAYQNDCHSMPSDFKAVTLKDLLAEQENYVTYAAETFPNVEFASTDTAIDQVVFRFWDNPSLEAVLITPGGQNSEPPCGIVTRWDVLHLTHSGVGKKSQVFASDPQIEE